MSGFIPQIRHITYVLSKIIHLNVLSYQVHLNLGHILCHDSMDLYHTASHTQRSCSRNSNSIIHEGKQINCDGNTNLLAFPSPFWDRFTGHTDSTAYRVRHHLLKRNTAVEALHTSSQRNCTKKENDKHITYLEKKHFGVSVGKIKYKFNGPNSEQFIQKKKNIHVVLLGQKK